MHTPRLETRTFVPLLWRTRPFLFQAHICTSCPFLSHFPPWGIIPVHWCGVWARRHNAASTATELLTSCYAAAPGVQLHCCGTLAQTIGLGWWAATGTCNNACTPVLCRRTVPFSFLVQGLARAVACSLWYTVNTMGVTIKQASWGCCGCRLCWPRLGYE